MSSIESVDLQQETVIRLVDGRFNRSRIVNQYVSWLEEPKLGRHIRCAVIKKEKEKCQQLTVKSANIECSMEAVVRGEDAVVPGVVVEMHDAVAAAVAEANDVAPATVAEANDVAFATVGNANDVVPELPLGEWLTDGDMAAAIDQLNVLEV